MSSAISIEDISKRFKLYHEKPHSLKERAIRFGRLTHEDFWALRDISIEVKSGETVGLLGHNGSGKSTLLKCVAGILRPTSGRIRSSGRMAALLELGAGFHPELTGRENVYLNGSILGMTRGEVDRIFDDVVAFAELENFIDNQVKHYSSGMYARLGFAVAVNVDPEILLIDEVLAVGDEAFQAKCLERIRTFQDDGRTILFVSHSPDLMRRVCNRVAVLDHGEQKYFGEPAGAVVAFRESLMARGMEVPEEIADAGAPVPTLAVRITHVEIDYPEPRRLHVLPGEPLRIRMGFEAGQDFDDLEFTIAVYDREGNRIVATDTRALGTAVGSVHDGGVVVWDFDAVPLLDGVYSLEFGIVTHEGSTVHDRRAVNDHFEVANPGDREGLVAIPIRASVQVDSSVARNVG